MKRLAIIALLVLVHTGCNLFESLLPEGFEQSVDMPRDLPVVVEDAPADLPPEVPDTPADIPVEEDAPPEMTTPDLPVEMSPPMLCATADMADLDGRMKLVSDAGEPPYIACEGNTDSYAQCTGIATFGFARVPSGTYTVEVEVLQPSNDANSFFVQHEDNPHVIWDIGDAETEGVWMTETITGRGRRSATAPPEYEPLVLEVTQPATTLRLKGREAGARVRSVCLRPTQEPATDPSDAVPEGLFLTFDPTFAANMSCTFDAPCTSLAVASRLAQPGQTIYFLPGDYDHATLLVKQESDEPVWGNPGDPGNPIRLTSLNDGRNTIIKGPYPANHRPRMGAGVCHLEPFLELSTQAHRNLEFSGFRVEGFHTIFSLREDAADILISRMSLRPAVAYAIDVQLDPTMSPSKIEVQRNTLLGKGPDGLDTPTMSVCGLPAGTRFGTLLNIDDAPGHTLDVENNIFVGSTTAAIYVFGADLSLRIQHNTIAETFNHAVVLNNNKCNTQSGCDITFRDNLIYDSRFTPVRLRAAPVDGEVVLSHNLAWRVDRPAPHAFYKLSDTDFMTADACRNRFANQCEGDINADPLVDSNFRPGQGSPALDAASGIDTPSNDRSGRSRQNTPDIGAYER